jgi:O-antigen/teichoic acid export membrane protein/O-antigen ligase
MGVCTRVNKLTIRKALGARWRSMAGRSVVGSLGASAGLQLLVIVSGVLVARSIGPEDRGYLALLIVVSSVCALAVLLGLPAAVTYYIARDPAHARRIVSSLAWVGVLQVGVMFVLQAAVLAALVASDPPHVRVAAAISVLLPPGILALSFGVAILQGQRRFTAYNLLRILPSTAYVAGVVIVYALNATSLVLFMALWAAVNLIGGFFALAFAVRGLPKPAKEESGPSRTQMVRFGLKALLGSLSPVDVVRLDQAVVGLFLSPVALGYYVVAQAFTQLPRVAASSIGIVAYPQVAAERDRHAARRAMWRFFFLGLALSALVVGALELMAGELIALFFGEEFTEATTIAQILLLASLFMAGRRVLTDGVNGLGYPGYGTIAEVTSWILLLPGLAILLPWFGAEGVALALAISWGASLLLLVILAVAAGRPAGARRKRLTEAMGALAPSARRPQGRVILAVTAAAVLSVLGGLAAAFFPSVALGLVIALTVALFFAFGRRALTEYTRSLQGRMADRRNSLRRADRVSTNAAGEGFDLPRRLYYAGVLLLGLLTLRLGRQVTFSDVLFLLSFLFACAELVVLRRRVSVKLPFLLLMGVALFSLGGFLSTFESLQPLKSIFVIARLVLLTVFWFWLGTVVLRRQEHVTRAISCWVASAAICGGGAILQLLVGDVIPNASIDGGRATGFTTHPNDLGALTAIAFVPALMLAARPRIAPAARAWSYLLLLLVAAGLVLSGSIGGLTAAAAATFVWLVFQRLSIHSLLAFVTLAACVVGLATLQSTRGAPDPLDRLELVVNPSSEAGGTIPVGSIYQRIGTYRVAIERIKEDPFVGVGLDLRSVTRPFGVEAYEYDVHNLVIGLWYKTGLVGLVGMLLVLLSVGRSAWAAVSESISTNEQRVAIALGSSVVAFVVFAMTAPVLFTRLGWISAALVLALRGIQQKQLASVEPAAERRVVRRPFEASASYQP